MIELDDETLRPHPPLPKKANCFEKFTHTNYSLFIHLLLLLFVSKALVFLAI